MATAEATVSAPGGSWRQEWMGWAFKQGPTFVILVLILVGVYMGLPDIVAAINAGHKEVSQANERNVEKINAANERNVEKLVATFRDETKELRADSRQQAADARQTAELFRQALQAPPR